MISFWTSIGACSTTRVRDPVREKRSDVVTRIRLTVRRALDYRCQNGCHFDLRLVERFTRVGPNTLLYEVTVDDPTFFTKPWTVRLPMIKTGEELHEFACHEGNYSLPNILRGARFQEQGDMTGSSGRPCYERCPP